MHPYQEMQHSRDLPKFIVNSLIRSRISIMMAPNLLLVRLTHSSTMTLNTTCDQTETRRLENA